ncbi:MAG: hypothetical protein WBC76_00590 [Actinomycetes bacterium]|jgi:hypothetical protein
MSRPEPRPALQRSGDGGLHPAAPRVATEQHIHPAPHAPAAATKEPKKRKGLKTIDRADDTVPVAKDSPADEAALPTFTGKPVNLSVTVPKDLRKRVRKLAERADASVDDVVAEALARHIARQP